MKITKKLSASLLAAVLLLSLAFTAKASAPEVHVIAPEAVPSAGTEFSVLVELDDNPGIVSVRLALKYDKTTLQCTDIEKGYVTRNMIDVSNPNAVDGAMFAAGSAEPVSANGAIVTFTFMVLRSDAEVPRDLTLVELGVLDGDLLPYTVVQMNEQGEIISAPQESGGGSAGEGTGASSGIPVDSPSESGPERPPETDAAPAFPDIGSHWGRTYITKAADLGYFNGYEDGSFRPDNPVTRAQFVTVLWRMAGKPAPTQNCPFKDIPQDKWYTDAVIWAHEKGYVNGRTESLFAPNDNISRQEAMKILFGFAGGVRGMEMMFTSIYDSDFSDSSEIAEWAKPAMYWGYG